MWLDPQNPYGHFNDESKPCYQRLWELEEGDDGEGNVHFNGARGFEAAAIAEAEAAANPPPPQAPVVPAQGLNPILQAPQDPIFADLEEALDHILRWNPGILPPIDWADHENGRRPAGRPRQARRPALGGQPLNLRRGAAGRNLGAQRRAHGGGGVADRREVEQMGGRNYLDRHRNVGAEDVEEVQDHEDLVFGEDGLARPLPHREFRLAEADVRQRERG